MAAIRDRVDSLQVVVESIAPQLDILYLYLNDYESVPGFLEDFPNVQVFLGCDAEGDLNANGKMVFLKYEKDGIAFALDDDIIYPSNYVDHLLSELSKYKYRACCAVHGSFIHDGSVWYYERSYVAGFRQRRDFSEIVNLVGSGTAAFPVREMRDFDMRGPVWVDLQISLRLLAAGCPLVVVPRSHEWLRPLEYEGLYEKYKDHVSHHTTRLHERQVWREDYLRELWREVLGNVEEHGGQRAVDGLGLSPTSVSFIEGDDNGHAIFGQIAMQKVTDFASIWADR